VATAAASYRPKYNGAKPFMDSSPGAGTVSQIQHWWLVHSIATGLDGCFLARTGMSDWIVIPHAELIQTDATTTQTQPDHAMTRSPDEEVRAGKSQNKCGKTESDARDLSS